MAKFRVRLVTRDSEHALVEWDVPDGQQVAWEPDPPIVTEKIMRFAFWNMTEHKPSDQETIAALRKRIAELEAQLEDIRTALDRDLCQ